MDIIIKAYREREMADLASKDPKYKALIKIMSNGGETKWLSITDKELLAIKQILTGEKI